MFRHILIPTDGSAVAGKAIRAGVALAKEMGATVTGFYAQEPVPAHIYGEGYIADKKLVAEFKRREREYADRCVAEVGAEAKAAGVPFEPVVANAAVPYKGIIDAADRQKCDAIFIASNGHRGLTGLLLGSVTHKVLTHSKIPVLVFR
jgi:nucleotide-binding universal stress UspA family protein